MVQELGKRLAALLSILGGVREFLQVFNAGERLRRPFFFERADVAGPVDKEADQLGKRRGVTRLAKAFIRGLQAAEEDRRSILQVSKRRRRLFRVDVSGLRSRSPKSKRISSHALESDPASAAHDSCSGTTPG